MAKSIKGSSKDTRRCSDDLAALSKDLFDVQKEVYTFLDKVNASWKDQKFKDMESLLNEDRMYLQEASRHMEELSDFLRKLADNGSDYEEKLYRK